MKKSQRDTEFDENPKIFQFSKFYAVFLKNFQQTPEIGLLERVNKQKQNLWRTPSKGKCFKLYRGLEWCKQ